MATKLKGVFVRFDIAALGDPDYGSAAYRDVARRLGDELRDMAFLSGDSAATLEGRDNKYIVAVVPRDQTRLDSLVLQLTSAQLRGVYPLVDARHISVAIEPLNIGLNLEGEPLADNLVVTDNGYVDAAGRLHPSDDGSRLHCLK